MLLTTSNTVSGILPGQWGPLLVEPVQQAAVALDPRVATLLTTGAHQFHVPIITQDASASWVNEGAEISPSDAVFSEVVVTPAKVAGLSIVSSELANDSNPAAAQLVGQGLARSIAGQIDAAFFGNLSTPAPSGLGSLTLPSANTIVAGVNPSNLDSFASAIAIAEMDATTITSFVCHPTDAGTLSKIKVGTGYATPLLGVDASNGTSRQVLGVPLVVTPRITPGIVWGLCASRNYVILRTDAEVVSDQSVYFTSDRVALRGTMRLGLAFPDVNSVVKIKLSAS